MLCAGCWFACQRAALFRATVLAYEKWPIRASLRPLGVYIYAFGSQSCATRLIFADSARLGPTKLRFCSKTLFLWAFRSAFSLAPQNATRFSAVMRPETKPRLAPLVEFGAVLGGSASHTSSDRLRRLGLRPAPCAAAPVVFAAIRAAMLRRRDTVSSPCDVSHRASDEPRRCMSLSSALAPSSLASPSIRRVFVRSFCARRRPVSSLNRAAYPPERSGVAEGELNAGCKSVAPSWRISEASASPRQIRRDFVRTIISFHRALILLFDGERANVV